MPIPPFVFVLKIKMEKLLLKVEILTCFDFQHPVINREEIVGLMLQAIGDDSGVKQKKFCDKVLEIEKLSSQTLDILSGYRSIGYERLNNCLNLSRLDQLLAYANDCCKDCYVTRYEKVAFCFKLFFMSSYHPNFPFDVRFSA